MMNYNDGKWHTWNGGECPVSNRTTVELIRKHKITGELVGYEGYAGETETGVGVNWCNEGSDLPIVAFRVIKENREPREWWVHPFVNDLSSAPIQGYVHVREVME